MDLTLAFGIFLLGTGVGALITRIAMRGQFRRLRNEIAEVFKASDYKAA